MKPVLQALVLAEHVYQDITGKKVIAGTFNNVRFTRKQLIREVEHLDGTKQMLVPGGMHGGSPYAYVSLTDASDGTKLLLQFVNLSINRVLFQTEAVLSGNVERLATIELVFPLPPLPIAEAGVYAFEVSCEGEILGSYRITAHELNVE